MRTRLLYPNLQLGCVGAWCPSMGKSRSTRLSDLSGYGNHGTLTTMDPGTDWVASGDGIALDFDGSDDHIIVTTVVIPIEYLAPPNITVSLWMKRHTTPVQFDGLLAKTNGASWTRGWGMFFNSATDVRFFIEHYVTNVAFATIDPLQWCHVAGTWDGTTIRMYVNGREGTSDAYSGVFNSDTAFEIGRLGSNTYNHNGQIDDIRIYNRALSPSAIAQLASCRGAAYKTSRKRVSRKPSASVEDNSGNNLLMGVAA